jgi:hypothetical protein
VLTLATGLSLPTPCGPSSEELSPLKISRRRSVWDINCDDMMTTRSDDKRDGQFHLQVLDQPTYFSTIRVNLICSFFLFCLEITIQLHFCWLFSSLLFAAGRDHGKGKEREEEQEGNRA